MRYQFIHAEKANFPIKLLCEVMMVSRSGYYRFEKSGGKFIRPHRQRLITNTLAIFKASGGSYGSRRIASALSDEGESVGRYQARSLMKEAGITVKRKKRFKVTTDSRHPYRIAPNILAREFDVDRPNRVWGSDITYLWTQEGWLYLAVVVDLFSRKVVGWSLSHRMTAELAINALNMAIGVNKPGKGVIHHSDRGSQYACHDYQKLLSKNGFVCSMSRKGNCWDNAVVERFFRSLKSEKTDHVHYGTRENAIQDVFHYIEMFYNKWRKHSYLGYVSPIQYENLANVA